MKKIIIILLIALSIGKLVKGNTDSTVYEKVIAEGIEKLNNQIQFNDRCIKSGKDSLTKYIINIGENLNNDNNNLIYIKDASKSPNFESLNRVSQNTINACNGLLQTAMNSSSIKSYIIIIHNLDFLATDKISWSNFHNALFYNDVSESKEDFEAISSQKLLFKKIITSICNEIITKLPQWSNNSLVFGAGLFTAMKKKDGNIKVVNFTGSDKIKFGGYRMEYTFPETFIESDTRKIFKDIFINYVLNNKCLQNPDDLLTLETGGILNAYNNLGKLQALNNASNCSEIDAILNWNFPDVEYGSFSIELRIKLLKILADCPLYNNSLNYRETFVVKIIEYTKKTEDIKTLLNALITEKINNVCLLKILTKKIDNGHLVNDAQDFNDFIGVISRFADETSPNKPKKFDELVLNGKAIEFKPGFWTGDMMDYEIDDFDAKITLKNIHEKKVLEKLDPYQPIGVVFKSSYTINEFKYQKKATLVTPAIFAYLLFNNSNTDNIKTGSKLAFDIVLLSTGIGELSMVLEAKNAFAIARSLWNIGWGLSDILINGPIYEKIKDSPKGQNFLKWYNRIQLIAGGVGLASSFAKNGDNLIDEYKKASKEFKDEVETGVIHTPNPNGGGEITNALTDAEKQVLKAEINESDELIKASGNATELSVELFKDYANIKNYISHSKYKVVFNNVEAVEFVNVLKTADKKVLQYLDDLDLDDFIIIAQKYKANKTVFVNNLSDVNNFKNILNDISATFDLVKFKTLNKCKPSNGRLTNLTQESFTINAHKVVPTGGALKTKVDEFIALGDNGANGVKAGYRTEKITDDIMSQNGYTKYEAKYGNTNENGYDGFYIKGTLENPTEIIIIESKQFKYTSGKSNGIVEHNNATLNPQSATTSLPAQMSDGWINYVAGKLKNNQSTSLIGNKVEELMLIDPNKISKYVVAIDKTRGEINFLKLSNY